MGINLVGFVGIALIVILAPGPDTVIVTKNALIRGRRAAIGTSLGVNTGLVIWTVTAAAGLAAVVRASGPAFTALKLAGAVYLVWLGIEALRAARAPRLADAASPQRTAGIGVGFRQGLFTNLGNPKIAVFFTSLLPQFVAPHHAVLVPFLVLGGVFVLINLAWMSTYAVMAVEFSALLRRPRVAAALDRISGVVLIGLGIRLALEHR